MHWLAPVADPFSDARRNFVAIPRRSSCNNIHVLAACRIAFLRTTSQRGGEGATSAANGSCQTN
eukprot:9489575-Pyramimonas_sp.AAC.1